MLALALLRRRLPPQPKAAAAAWPCCFVDSDVSYRGMGVFSTNPRMTFQMVPLFFQMVLDMTKLITRQIKETHNIFGGKNLRSTCFFF